MATQHKRPYVYLHSKIQKDEEARKLAQQDEIYLEQFQAWLRSPKSLSQVSISEINRKEWSKTRLLLEVGKSNLI